jgi:hypothetical protein
MSKRALYNKNFKDLEDLRVVRVSREDRQGNNVYHKQRAP